jgi:hypothetical protein
MFIVHHSVAEADFASATLLNDTDHKFLNDFFAGTLQYSFAMAPLPLLHLLFPDEFFWEIADEDIQPQKGH